MKTPYTREAMQTRLKAAKAEHEKLAPKLEAMQADYAKANTAARKLRDKIVEAKVPVAELAQEIASLHRALGARGVALEAGTYEAKTK